MLNDIKKQFVEGKTLFQFGFFKGLGLIVPLIIARFFSEDMFGTYSLAKLVVFFFVTLLIVAPQVPFVVYASRERAETRKINKSFSIQLIFFAFGIFIFVVSAMLFNRRLRDFAGVSTIDFIYISAGFMGIALSSFIFNLFLALGQRIKSSLAEFIYGLINLGVVIGLCFADKLSIKTVFGAYFISAIGILLIFVKTIDFSQLRPFYFEWSLFRKMFNFTKWLFIGAVAMYFIDWGDNIILKIFKISNADIGQYSLAYQIFNGIVTIIYILNGYFLPFISENINDVAKMRDYLFNKRPRILLFGFVLLAAAFIACPAFFKVLYPNSYHDSVAILRILLIGSLLILYNTFYLPLLNAMQMYRFSQTVNIVTMLLKMFLNTMLVAKYGFYGAAVGSTISYLCSTLIYESYYRIKMKKRLGIKRLN